jgi:S1-C subfamily serine protease
MCKHGYHIVVVAALLLLSDPARAADGDDLQTHKSVVKIFASMHQPELYRPWTKASPQESTGSGVVIAGKRILTNAHVANYASQLYVQFDKSSDKLPATVVALAPGIDLAILKLADESIFDTHPPLTISSKLPSLQQSVLAYGFPQGGSELSITRGIVSRIEFSDYYIGVQGLRVQIDAAINPGNSGGPVVANGQFIGLVFSKLDKADNIGYIIPMEEVNLFLDDIKDGRYDGKPILPVETQALENETLRARYKIPKKTTGVLVTKIHRPDTSYELKIDDILIKIGNHEIDDHGNVRLDGDRLLSFIYPVQRLVRGGRLPLTLLRNGQEMKLDLPVDSNPRRLFRDLGEEPQSYFIYGPLVFTEASDEYVRSMTSYVDNQEGGGSLSMIYTGIPTFARYGADQDFAGERIVIVSSPMFTHKISRGYKTPYTQAVKQVNGAHVRNLPHFIELLRDANGEFIEFSFHGRYTDKVVFNRKEVVAATDEILSDNGIRQQCSPDMAKIWDLTKSR